MAEGLPIPAELKDRIFEAVQEELLAAGIDGFNIEAVARRAGVDRSVILGQWRDRRVLLMDVMLARTRASAWSRDTGTVRTDLAAVSTQAIELSQTARGRALFRRVLPGDTDVDLSEICSDLWDARFKDGALMLQRAADRGQLRDGVDPLEAIRMLCAAFYYDVIFTDRPVRPEFAEQVVDIFLNGVLGPSGRDRHWPDVEQLLRHPAPGDVGVAAEQAVEAARRAVVLMRMWADALPDAVVLYEAVRDDSGRVVDLICRDLNRAAYEEVGLTRPDLLGRHIVEMLPNFASSGLLEHYAECLDSGKPLELNDFPYRLFDQDRRLDIRATTPARDLITVTWRDITERHESALRDDRYRMLTDYSAIPTSLVDPEGRMISVNQALASMLGYDIPTLLTMRWQDFTAPENVDRESEIVADIQAGRRENFRAVKEYVHADGHRVYGDLSLGCIRRADGSVENMIAQVIDVTAYYQPGQV